MPSFLFALLLALGTDTANLKPHPNEHTWIYGRWLQAPASSEAEKSPGPEAQQPRGDKHMLLFHPDGQLHRYSPHKGWDRLLLNVTVNEDTAILRHRNKSHYFLTAEKTEAGVLKVCMPRGGHYYYKKITPDIPLEAIDFSCPLFPENDPCLRQDGPFAP